MLKIEIVLHCRNFSRFVDYREGKEFFQHCRLQTGNELFPALHWSFGSKLIIMWPNLQDIMTWSLPYENCFVWICMAVTYLFIAWSPNISVVRVNSWSRMILVLSCLEQQKLINRPVTFAMCSIQLVCKNNVSLLISPTM